MSYNLLKVRSLSPSLLISVLFSFVFSGCAVLHHVQVGQVDNRDGVAQIPFEILISEVGVNTEQIGDIARSTKSRGGDQAARVADMVALFQLGPRTGNPVYNEKYAQKLIYEIHQKCPSGRISGLMSIREMREYPVISGEIVKVTGYCLKPRSQSEISEDDKRSPAAQKANN